MTHPPAPLQPHIPLDSPILPAAPAGSLPGSGNVDPTGEYHYRLPLDVPAGRAGMEPHLALSYNSRGPNGHLGAGWALEGLSEISACPKTFATEGLSDGVHPGEGNAFCLDGHKLVDIGGELRNEDDTFARVLSWDQTKDGTFQVWTKDGHIRRYWPSADNVWLLGQEQDRSGNAITYTYEHWQASGGAIEYAPGRIDYTHRLDAGGEIDEEGRRSVSFHYELRPDPSYAELGGVRRLQRHRLKRISVWTEPSHPAWSYDLAYLDPSPASGASRLASVQRCGREGGCLPKKTFTWESARGFTYDLQTVDGVPNDALPPVVADLDGDGRDELVLLRDTGDVLLLGTADPAHPLGEQRKALGLFSFVHGFDFLEAKPVDLDGDGRAEIVAPGPGNVQSYQVLRLVNQATDPTPVFVNSGIPVAGLTFDLSRNPLHVVDLDGDGLPDLVHGHPNAAGWWDWAYSKNLGGLQFGPLQNVPQVIDHTGILPLTVPVPGYGTTSSASFAVDPGRRRPMIFTGWQKHFLNKADSSFWGFSLDAQGTPHEEFVQLSEALLTFADLNGDGIRELVSFDPDTTSLCARAAGAPAIEALCAPVDFQGLPHDDLSTWSLQSVDLDADGKDEILFEHRADERKVLFFQGDAEGKIAPLASPPDFPAPDAIGDFDGDGLLDVTYRGDDGWKVYRQTGAGTIDRLTGVHDDGSPAARETALYSNAWSPSPDPASCVYPQRCMRHGFTVVREHDVGQGMGTGIPAPRRMLYNYDDPRFDVRGRGFLGFATVRAWDPGRRAETITSYDNQSAVGSVYPGALRPKTIRRAVMIGDDLQGTARLSQIDTVYQLDALHGGKTTFVHPSSWMSLEWEEDVSMVPEVGGLDTTKEHLRGIDGADEHSALRVRKGHFTYDEYGNVLDSTVSTVGGETTAIVSTYDIREKDWLVGLVKSEETTVTEAGQPAPAPRRRDYVYENRGLLCHVYVEKQSADPAIPAAQTFFHDPEGLVRAVTTSAAGQPWRTTHFAYEPDERVSRTEAWNDLGHAEHALSDPAFGVPLVTEDANGARTRYRYDDLGRVRRIEPEGGGAASIDIAPRLAAWGVVGASLQVTEDGGGEARTDYDEVGREVGRAHRGFDGSWIEEATTFDSLGRVATVSRPGVGAASLLVTTYKYDRLDRVLLETRPDGTTVQRLPSFYTTWTWDPLLHETDVGRDRDDRVIHSTEVVGGQDRVTSFVYGPFGELAQVNDPEGHAIVLHYDARGRRHSLADPDAGLTTFQYNGFGDVELRTAGGFFTHHLYDGIGRLKETDDSEGSTLYSWDTAPHGIGQLAHTQSPDGTAQDFAYDSLGRLDTLTYTVNGAPYAFTTKYDSSGRPSLLSYPEVPGRPRFTVARAYDSATGYLKSVYDPSLGSFYFRIDGRNSDDRLTGATFGNGVASARTYKEETGRLWTFTEGKALGLTYDYDLDGNVSLRGDAASNRNEHYGYDELHRLTSWTLDGHGETDYHYDDDGNLHEVWRDGLLQEHGKFGQNGRPHALTQSAAGHYKYDPRGREKGAPARTTTYTDFDLPRTITQPGIGTTTFSYDATGARVRKGGPAGSVITLGGLYERRESAGHVVHVFYVPGEDGPAAQVVYDETAASAATEYLHTDPLGSVGAVTADISGAVTGRLFYEPFGKRIEADGSPLGAVKGDVAQSFAGHRHDDELGLVDMRGRVYEPGTRRFLTPDPHVTNPRLSQSYNRYGYVLANPTNLVDPSGLDCIGLECVGDFLAGAFGDPLGFELAFGGAADSAGSGSSTLKQPTGGPVTSSEDRRPMGLPTGPAAVAAPIAGPVVLPGTGPDDEEYDDPPEASWRMNPGVQFFGGLFGGAALGLTPFGGVGDRLLSESGAISKGTHAAQMGKAFGEMLGGLVLTAGGVGGEIGGLALDATGIGALVGVPAMVVSAGAVTAGAGNMAAGLQGFSQAMRSGEQPTETGEAKRGPKPWPTGAHNETIARRLEQLEAQGYKHLNGGDKKEEVLDIYNGYKSSRRPDITMKAPDGSIYRENVGRTLANGSPVPREVEALDDIEAQTGVRPVFTPYDR